MSTLKNGFSNKAYLHFCLNYLCKLYFFLFSWADSKCEAKMWLFCNSYNESEEIYTARGREMWYMEKFPKLFYLKKKCLFALYSEDCMNFCICLVEADMHAYVEVMTLPHEWGCSWQQLHIYPRHAGELVRPTWDRKLSLQWMKEQVELVAGRSVTFTAIASSLLHILCACNLGSEKISRISPCLNWVYSLT